MKRKVPKTMAACFALIEREMLKGPWVMGEQYTICDPYLYTIATWLEGDGVDLAALPKVADHRKRMSERPAVRKVLAEEGLNEGRFRISNSQTFAIPRLDARAILYRFARREGAGNTGCTLHPRSRVQCAYRKRTRAYRYSRSSPAFPAQWFYGL